MYVKGNAILSKMFAHCGLTLNEIGLYCYHENTQYFVEITKDPIKIAEIIGFDYAEFDAAKEYDEFFELLMTNPFFRPSRFLVDPSEGKNRMFKELAELLAEKPCLKGYTKRNLEDMFEPLAEFDFKAKYDRMNYLFDNVSSIRKKLSGIVVLRVKPDFDKRELQKHFELFNNSFENTMEILEFLDTHSEEQLVEHFINLK